MQTKKLFLASSSELQEDRKEFEIFINRKNKEWVSQGGFIELIVWEDFLDAVSQTRLQDEYNQAIRECDVFVMLFFTKVGKYTAEEFETAFGQFKATNKPFIDSGLSSSWASRFLHTHRFAIGDFYRAIADFGVPETPDRTEGGTSCRYHDSSRLRIASLSRAPISRLTCSAGSSAILGKKPPKTAGYHSMP